MSEPFIIPQNHSLSNHDRTLLLGNRSLVIWLTGLSGSGKSTLANELEQMLHKAGVLTYILDGDNVRSGLNSDLGFGERDRRENIRRIGEVAKLMSDAGVVVITAFISPFREDREMVRKMLGKDGFAEIYVKCPFEKCEERDVKGLYAKARNGEIREFTGIDSPYEEPVDPELIIDTSVLKLDVSAKMLFDFVDSKIKL